MRAYPHRPFDWKTTNTQNVFNVLCNRWKYLWGRRLGCNGEMLDSLTSYPDATPANMAAMLYRTSSTMLSFGFSLWPYDVTNNTQVSHLNGCKIRTEQKSTHLRRCITWASEYFAELLRLLDIPVPNPQAAHNLLKSNTFWRRPIALKSVVSTSTRHTHQQHQI